MFVPIAVPVSVTQPPIFSGKPERKRTLSISNQVPSLDRLVDSRLTPGRNLRACSDMA